MTRTAIIAGAGALPAALAKALQRPYVAALEGYPPKGLTPDVTFRVERLVPFLNLLQDQGIQTVAFAGAVQRPRLDPALFDPQTAQLVPRLLAAMQGGDDATLRAILTLFEEFGFSVASTADIAPDLVPGAGILAGTLTPALERDATRAALITTALGQVDVGQAAVVQNALCLGVEALPGTDALLRAVAAIDPLLRSATPAGVLYKAPKPGQDRRVDLPTIGPDTLRGVIAAGLQALVWEAGGTILLDRTALVEQAQAAGITLWSRAP